MKAGDLVKADDYLSPFGGHLGIVIELQPGDHCVTAYVLFGSMGIKLARVENLKILHAGVQRNTHI